MLQKVNISIHDVTKSNIEKVYFLKEFLEDLGVGKITFLLVPFYHEKESLFEIKNDLENFITNGEFVLHGYTHKSGCFKWPKNLFTNCEGEFEYYKDLDERIKKGLEIFNQMNIYPKIFIPPAWMMKKENFTLLKKFGIRFTEDRLYIYDIEKNSKIFSPVLSFGSRGILKDISILSFGIYFRLLKFSKIKFLRIALHPIDADIEEKLKVLVKILRNNDFEYIHLSDIENF